MKLIIEKLNCKRCGNNWWPKIEDDEVTTPKSCPKCKSPYWDRKITRPEISVARKKH